jgi:hypothetical protein
MQLKLAGIKIIIDPYPYQGGVKICYEQGLAFPVT